MFLRNSERNCRHTGKKRYELGSIKAFPFHKWQYFWDLNDFFQISDQFILSASNSSAAPQELVELINSNRVLVVSGETGCGKTTQVTQFILDDHINRGMGSMCRVVCTQPRRISAISVYFLWFIPIRLLSALCLSKMSENGFAWMLNVMFLILSLFASIPFRWQSVWLQRGQKV